MAVIGNVATNDIEKETFKPLSRFMALIEYDPKTLTMDVTFHSGAKTRYLVVYPNTFSSFKDSPTHDSYYSRAIKGNLRSVSIINTSIGRKQSSPLNKVKKEQPLDRGLRKQRATRERIAGTVARAFAT